MASVGRWTGACTWLLACFVCAGPAEAQVGSPIRQVRWPLLDIIMVPDSGGLWFLAGPNPDATQWESGSYLVRFTIDPVVALQWVTLARKLAKVPSATPAQFSPPLPAQKGPALAILGTHPTKPSKETQFVLIVSDSAGGVRWKSFASSAQVDELLNALEATARDSRAGRRLTLWDTLPGQDPDTPVSIVSQPTPAYPAQLGSRGRIGRVWMMYVVSREGSVEPGSFFPLLSDDSLFTESATRALLKGRFNPAMTNGKPVPQLVFQAIVFRARE